jgi:hypothetical protein
VAVPDSNDGPLLSVFEIMGEAGVFPVMYPNGAKMTLGRLNWPELIFWARARDATRKKVSVFAGSEFGWILVGSR